MLRMLLLEHTQSARNHFKIIAHLRAFAQRGTARWASHDPVLSGSSGRPVALTCQGKLACTEPEPARFRTSGFDLHPRRQIKMPRKAAFRRDGYMNILRVGLCPSRLKAIRPSLSACASGPPTRLGASASQNAVRFGRTSGFDLHPRRQIKMPRKAAFLFGGEGGIRTHVPGFPDHLISSQRRYGHFGTSPDSCVILPVMCSIANLPSRRFGY